MTHPRLNAHGHTLKGYALPAIMVLTLTVLTGLVALFLI